MVELSTIARIVVGLILLWAAAAKLRRRDDLPDWLTAYGLPARYARETAWAVMAIEAVVGVLLLFGIALPASAYAAVLLGVSVELPSLVYQLFQDDQGGGLTDR